jgi:hypothetical protein
VLFHVGTKPKPLTAQGTFPNSMSLLAGGGVR